MMGSRIADPEVLVRGTISRLDAALRRQRTRPGVEEIGTVERIGRQIALVTGLPGVAADEVVLFAGDHRGFACNLDPEHVGVVMLDESADIAAGGPVRRTGRVLDVPVGDALLGRVVDPLGRPLDKLGPVTTARRLEIEREAPPLMWRAPVTVPLQTGLKVVDALIPIGRGQRELILGDRQTGKTAIGVDAIINQRGHDVVCIYCAIGQQSAAVARVVEQLTQHNAIANTIVVVASGDAAAGLQYIAPYAATSMGEYFRDRGRDVLVVFDDLTRHARAYRELSLLLRRPPGREAFPGDVFYLHARLLERATHLRPEHGGGSLTALPICETEAQDISAYISTNLISITDGQIFLTPTLLHKGILPAVDVGRSVSRVGGKAQLAAYRNVSGELRLAYAQFEELEAFSRFGTKLDPHTRATLERGGRAREVLRQPQLAPLRAAEQIAALLALNSGCLDAVPIDRVAEAEVAVRAAVLRRLEPVCRDIERGTELSDGNRAALLEVAADAVKPLEEHGDAGA